MLLGKGHTRQWVKGSGIVDVKVAIYLMNMNTRFDTYRALPINTNYRDQLEVGGNAIKNSTRGGQSPVDLTDPYAKIWFRNHLQCIIET